MNLEQTKGKDLAKKNTLFLEYHNLYTRQQSRDCIYETRLLHHISSHFFSSSLGGVSDTDCTHLQNGLMEVGKGVLLCLFCLLFSSLVQKKSDVT